MRKIAARRWIDFAQGVQAILPGALESRQHRRLRQGPVMFPTVNGDVAHAKQRGELDLRETKLLAQRPDALSRHGAVHARRTSNPVRCPHPGEMALAPIERLVCCTRFT